MEGTILVLEGILALRVAGLDDLFLRFCDSNKEKLMKTYRKVFKQRSM